MLKIFFSPLYSVSVDVNIYSCQVQEKQQDSTLLQADNNLISASQGRKSVKMT